MTGKSLVEIQVSNYDRIQAWLIATIIVVGFVVLVLGVLLMQEQVVAGHEGFAGEGKNKGEQVVLTELDQDDLVDPTEEAPDLANVVIDESLFEKVTDVVSTTRAGTSSQAKGDRAQEKGGVGQRQPQPPQLSLQEYQRWSILYELKDIAGYAVQLRTLGIELGVIHSTQNVIWRIADVGKTNKVTESNRKQASGSTYFVSTDRKSKNWDRRFITQAKVNDSETLVVHFYPEKTLQLMRQAEAKAIPKGKNVGDIKTTKFQLKRVGEGFQFEVEELQFR